MEDWTTLAVAVTRAGSVSQGDPAPLEVHDGSSNVSLGLSNRVILAKVPGVC